MNDEDLLAGRSVATNAGDAPGYVTDVRAGRHHVIADEPESRRGTDEGPSPTQLLIGALASCTAITLRMYAQRKGWDLGDVKVDCRIFYRAGDRRDQIIERSIELGGVLDDDQRSRLVEIADRTPVTLAIAGATPITTTLH